MKSKINIEHFKNRLKQRRETLFNWRKRIDRSWKELHEREIEFEEAAQKESLAEGLDQLDELEKNEIEAIDAALHKISAGSYGICESCGEIISEKRLEAIPWTRYCSQCARKHEEGPAIEEAEPEIILRPIERPEYRDMSDRQLQNAIYQVLKDDGRVELEELDVSVDKGIVTLNGALPDESRRKLLLEILRDRMGIENLVDNLRIDRVLWQRRDRTP